MRRRIFILLCLMLPLVFFSQTGFAGTPSKSVKTMATILNYVNHYPGDDEKQKLNKIVHSKKASDQEKAIASAMINLNHSASSADKRKLSKIVDDSSAPQAVRDLARIVRDLNHKPSSSDKKILKKYMW